MVKKSGCNAGDSSSIPGSGTPSGEGHGNPLQCSCLDRVPWTEEPGRLQSMWSQRIGHDWVTNTTLASKLQNLGPLNFLDAFLWPVDPRPPLSILHLTVKLSETLGGKIKPGPWTQWCAGKCLTASSLEGEGSPTVQHCAVLCFFFPFVERTPTMASFANKMAQLNVELGRGIHSGLSGARRSLLQHTTKGVHAWSTRPPVPPSLPGGMWSPRTRFIPPYQLWFQVPKKAPPCLLSSSTLFLSTSHAPGT